MMAELPDNVRVYPQRLPAKVRGFCVRCEDYYTVILNDAHSYETQRKTLAHEIAHIVKEDFTRYDVGEIEIKAH